MIYNRPMHNTDTVKNEERHNPIVLCADMDEVSSYSPVRVSRRRVRRRARRIRKKAGRISRFKLFVTVVLSLCCAFSVMYCSHNDTDIPDDMKSAVIKIASDAADIAARFAEKGKNNIETYLSGEKRIKSIPVYLNASMAGVETASPQRVVVANGCEPFGDIKSDITEQSPEALDVAAQTKGKSGSDGKIYLPLVSRNLSSNNMLLLSNQTRLTPDMHLLSESIPKAYENLTLSDKPLVLILHTHGTESYSSGKDGTYEKNEPTRSDNTEENVVAVGRTLAQTLEDFGIPVLHSETLHDKASFLNAYTSSLNQAYKLLSENPSIRFVIDLHRDAIVSESGEKTAPVCVIAGEEYAQLMFVIGTNESGFNHPDWQDNLCFALDMQKSIDEVYPGLMRPINLRSVSFNEQLSSGYVLLETGACGNTLEQAKRSAQAFGTVLAKRILQNLSV